MAQEVSLKTRLKQEIIANYERDYDALLATFRDLDTKGSGIIGVAGIFLAAAFAFVEGNTPEPALWVTVLLVLTLVGLVSSILAALGVLHVRKVARPPSPDSLERMASDLFADGEPTAKQRLGDYYGELAARWRHCVESLNQANQAKSKWLMTAQLLLVVAVVLASMLTITRMGWA